MCRVTMGHLRVTVGVGHPRVTIGLLRVTMGHLRLTIGYFKATVTSGNYRLFFSISKYKANTTVLHLKVRQTCYFVKVHEKVLPWLWFLMNS